MRQVVPCRRRHRMSVLAHQLVGLSENKKTIHAHFAHMCDGKHRVQHFSLLSVLVPLIKVRAYSCNSDRKIPKVPKSPGPKYRRFPLYDVSISWLMLNDVGNLLNKC